MQITDKLLRPLTEVKYLNADNVDRYRCIMRIFFENYEKLHYWMYQEKVYAQMKEDLYFAEYRPEQCLLRTENTGIRCQNIAWRSSVWWYVWRICLSKGHHWNRRFWSGFASVFSGFLRWQNWMITGRESDDIVGTFWRRKKKQVRNPLLWRCER